MLEYVLLLNWGNVVFYDGNKATTIDQGLAMPNGIAIDKKNSLLFCLEN